MTVRDGNQAANDAERTAASTGLYLPSVVEPGEDVSACVELLHRVDQQNFDVCEHRQPAMVSRIHAEHPWAMYAVVGIAVAYGTFRTGRANLLSEAFVPLFGRRAVDGAGGKIINILAIFSTLFGSAASLGLGALQIGSGLQFNGLVGQIATPLLAVLMAVVIFVVGPTLVILNLIPSAIGTYAQQLPETAARTEAVGDEAMREWLSGWAIFYRAWWISWTPLVGVFISCGRRPRSQ